MIVFSTNLELFRVSMEKRIIKDKIYKIDNFLLLEQKPIRISYNGIINPIFIINTKNYSLSTHRPHTTLVFKQLDKSFMKFLLNLDELIPSIAYERRKNWFTSDLFDLNFEQFVKNYRINLNNGNFSIYLGLVNCDELPVMTYVKDVSGISNISTPLKNSFQELAWGSLNGYITVLAEISGLWIKEESYGLSWKVMQILYRRNTTFPIGSKILSLNQIKDHVWKVPSTDEDGENNDYLNVLQEVSNNNDKYGGDTRYNPLLETDD